MKAADANRLAEELTSANAVFEKHMKRAGLPVDGPDFEVVTDTYHRLLLPPQDDSVGEFAVWGHDSGAGWYFGDARSCDYSANADARQAMRHYWRNSGPRDPAQWPSFQAAMDAAETELADAPTQ